MLFFCLLFIIIEYREDKMLAPEVLSIDILTGTARNASAEASWVCIESKENEQNVISAQQICPWCCVTGDSAWRPGGRSDHRPDGLSQ
jgi:hypothetical protein